MTAAVPKGATFRRTHWTPSFSHLRRDAGRWERQERASPEAYETKGCVSKVSGAETAATGDASRSASAGFS